MPATRPCAGPAPGRPCPTRKLVPRRGGPYCPACQQTRQRARQHVKDARRPHLHDPAETRRRARTVAEHVRRYGQLCPGCPPSGWQPHPVDPQRNPLTADHLYPPGAGHPEHGPLRVMCRKGNSTLGARGGG
jgi:hypothetical protein